MRFVGKFFGFLWEISRAGNRVNYGRGPEVIFTFLFLIFLVVGLVLVVLGFDLQAVDVWLDAHGSLFSRAGDLLWRALCAVVLLMCGLTAATFVSGLVGTPQRSPTPLPKTAGRQRKRATTSEEPKPNAAGKLLGILACLTIGYFAFIGVFWRN